MAHKQENSLSRILQMVDITDGYHCHPVRADSTETLNVIEKALSNRGYVIPEI